jgi:hypothetical protein
LALTSYHPFWFNIIDKLSGDGFLLVEIGLERPLQQGSDMAGDLNNRFRLREIRGNLQVSHVRVTFGSSGWDMCVCVVVLLPTTAPKPSLEGGNIPLSFSFPAPGTTPYHTIDSHMSLLNGRVTPLMQKLLHHCPTRHPPTIANAMAISVSLTATCLI